MCQIQGFFTDIAMSCRTPQSGLLTAASKLVRKTIEKHFEKEIKAVYA